MNIFLIYVLTAVRCIIYTLPGGEREKEREREREK